MQSIQTNRDFESGKSWYFPLWLGILFVFGSNSVAVALVGTRVPPGNFDAVVLLTSENSHCTGTIIGPRTLLTAAHCVEKGGSSFELNGIHYGVQLTRAKGYHPILVNLPFEITGTDFAVGIIDREIHDIDFIPISDSTPAVGREVVLLGCGVASEEAVANDNYNEEEDLVLRIGSSFVQRIKKGKFEFMTGTRNGRVLADILIGDSGGPSLIINENQSVEIIGVHSKNALDQRLDLESAQKFLRKFAKNKKVAICGITQACPRLLTPTELALLTR